MQNLGRIADAPSGQIPIAESRFGTKDIKLSSALCALGFSIRLDAQPVTISINADTQRSEVTFFHEDSTKLGNFSARDVDLWWRSPAGVFTIEGYDDALIAMKRVHQSRWEMINASRNGPKFKVAGKSITGTQSLHEASCLNACDIPLLGYDPSCRRWVFGKGAESIRAMIAKGGRPKSRPLSNDLCIDWMLEALRYRDFLAKLIRDPECIPLIEMRDGERILQISKGMNKKDAERMINRL